MSAAEELTPSNEPEATTGRRRLALAPAATGDLARHPDDGWIFADPYPMGAGSLRVLRALIRAFLPPTPAPTEEGLELRIATHVRRMMQYMPRPTAKGFLLTMHLLNWAPLWRLRALRTVTRLPITRSSEILADLAGSRFMVLRLLMLGPKGLILSTYFDQDLVHRELDYEPVSFTKERIALRERLLAGHADAEASRIEAPEELS